MPYEQALAHYEIGRHTADPAHKTEHMEKTTQLLDEMGITFFD